MAMSAGADGRVFPRAQAYNDEENWGIAREFRFSPVPERVRVRARPDGGRAAAVAPTLMPPRPADRLLMPSFSTARVRDMFDDMVDICEQTVTKWERCVLLCARATPRPLRADHPVAVWRAGSDRGRGSTPWRTLRVSRSTRSRCAR